MSEKLNPPVNVEPFEPLPQHLGVPTISVWQQGKLIKKYVGEDITLVNCSKTEVQFITGDGKMHTILYNQGLVIIDNITK